MNWDNLINKMRLTTKHLSVSAGGASVFVSFHKEWCSDLFRRKKGGWGAKELFLWI
jgi:hypothetical protein